MLLLEILFNLISVKKTSILGCLFSATFVPCQISFSKSGNKNSKFNPWFCDYFFSLKDVRELRGGENWKDGKWKMKMKNELHYRNLLLHLRRYFFEKVIQFSHRFHVYAKKVFLIWNFRTYNLPFHLFTVVFL